MKPLEDAKQFAPILHVKPDAVIPDVKQPFRFVLGRAQFDPGILLPPGEFEGIGHQVKENLA